MAEIREQRLPENAPIRALFGRVDSHGARLSGIEAALGHLVSHKALIGYAAVAIVVLFGAVWALLQSYQAQHRDEVIEIKANAYRQEVKIDTVKDLIITGQLKPWPATPRPAPEVQAVIEGASR